MRDCLTRTLDAPSRYRTPNAKAAIIIRFLHESRKSPRQHGRAADPHLGGARPGRARPARPRAARGFRAGAIQDARLFRPGNPHRRGSEHVAAEARGQGSSRIEYSKNGQRPGGWHRRGVSYGAPFASCGAGALGRDQAEARRIRAEEPGAAGPGQRDAANRRRGERLAAPGALRRDRPDRLDAGPAARLPRAARRRRQAVCRGGRGACHDRPARQLHGAGRLRQCGSIRNGDRAARKRRGAAALQILSLSMKQITAAELSAWLADAGRAKPLLLDVREPWEYEKARIEGSQLVPMGEIPARLGELDPDREVIAICHHGGRSMQVAMFLEKSGFAKAHNLAGGIDSWSKTVDPSVPLY